MAPPSGKRIVILGSSFAGFTAALELRRRLRDPHTITVVSRSDEFLFMPSLIWVPFGLRQRQDISFPVAPVLARKGIGFHHAPIERIDLPGREVHTAITTLPYDFLVIATGPHLDFGAVPGLGPHAGHTESIFTWEEAERARAGYERLLADPGPVVIGAVQGSPGFHAAFEFLLNMAHQLGLRGLRDRAPLTYVTAEPYLGHLGVGGFGRASKAIEDLLRRQHIGIITDVAVTEIVPGEVHLSDNRIVPFSYAMLAPPMTGIAPVRACADIVDGAGFVRTDAHYRTAKYPEVFAAGVAVSMPAAGPTAIPCAVPKTGYLSEEMAKVVAHNIAATVHGAPLISLPPESIDAKWILDAGDTGFILTADHHLEPREHAWLIPGPEAHWAKVALERYVLSRHSHGRV